MKSNNADAAPAREPKTLTWRAAVMAAKREALAQLPPEDQAQAKADQQAARERAAARKEASRRLAQTIYSMVFSGSTIDEIVAAIERSTSSVRQICARWGFPVPSRGQIRTFYVTIASARVDALDRAAADRGSTRAQTLEDAMAILLDDDANAGRRLLGVRRRKDG